MGNYVACKKYKKKMTKCFHKFYEHPFGINCKKLCRYRHRYSIYIYIYLYIWKLIAKFGWKFWIINMHVKQLMRNSCFSVKCYSCFLIRRKKNLQWYPSVVSPSFVQEIGFFLTCVINWMHCFLPFTINKLSFLCLFRFGKQWITKDIS